MAPSRAWLALALLVAPALTGCLADLERQRLDTGWEASGSLHAVPDRVVEDHPAQLVVEGALSLPETETVELTGVRGSLSQDNRTIRLTATSLTLGDEPLPPSVLADGRREVTDGTQARVAMLARHASGARLDPGSVWQASAELQYRFRDGQSFDAGRFVFEANLTAKPPVDLGAGVREGNGTSIRSLVFEDVGQQPRPSEAGVRVHHVTGAGAQIVENRSATVASGEGVVLVELERPVEVPQGSGYLLLGIQDRGLVGVVAEPDRAPEQPLPAAGVLVVAASLAAVAAGLGRRPE